MWLSHLRVSNWAGSYELVGGQEEEGPVSRILVLT
jgi:hypothetical protein